MAFHDLTPGKIIPPVAKEVLGYNLKFIPTPRFTTGSKSIDDATDRLERDVDLKIFFAGEDKNDDEDEYHPKLYDKSIWRPHPKYIPVTVNTRLHRFHQRLLALFTKRRSRSNLRPSQLKLLQSIRADKNVLIVNADKGLGPCAVTYQQYVTDALKHLTDVSTYQRLTSEEAFTEAKITQGLIMKWCDKHCSSLPESWVNFIRGRLGSAMKEPFGYFYLMYKIHKKPTSTRPVCSDCSSIAHHLGKLIDILLQPVAQGQPSFFKNSAEFKKLLQQQKLPKNASLFTCDARSMYTNIPTDIALAKIKIYLHQYGHTYGLTDGRINALCDALEIVMTRNIVQFGDTFWKQICGTAMGICPAPPWAIIYFALHESTFVPKWLAHVPFWKRYIDDGIGVWIHHVDPAEDRRLWKQFMADVNEFEGLTWDFVGPAKSIDFMDLTIQINDGTMHFTMFEKPLNLYLYIPPNSAHPPGVATGLIFGNILRIHQLCSDESDIENRILQFFRRLRACNYCPEKLLPLFTKAIKNAKAYLKRSPAEHAARKLANESSAERRVFLHLPFHPHDPTSKEVQRIWREQVMHPPEMPPLQAVTNDKGHRVPIDRLTIAYHRAPNLGNSFSVRKFQKLPGLSVSSFLD